MAVRGVGLHTDQGRGLREGGYKRTLVSGCGHRTHALLPLQRPAALPLSLRAPSATEQWASAWPAAPAAESPSDGSSGSSDEEDTAGAEADGAATVATTEAEEQAYKLLEKQTRAFTNVRLQALGGEVANFGVGRPHSASLPSSMGFGSTHAESLMEVT